MACIFLGMVEFIINKKEEHRQRQGKLIESILDMTRWSWAMYRGGEGNEEGREEID